MNFDLVKIRRIILRWTFHIVLKKGDIPHFVSSEKMKQNQEKDCERWNKSTKSLNENLKSSQLKLPTKKLFLKR